MTQALSSAAMAPAPANNGAGGAVVPFRQQQQTYGIGELERMALALAGSKLFGIQTPDQALALCLVAQSEGRHPATAAQDYHIISGRPSKKADAMLRDFLASGGRVEWHRLDDDAADATFAHPMGGTVRISWDHERAKAAQIKNPMWTKFPRQMLRSRVVSEGVRTVCPGATSGMYEPSEVQEFEPQQTVVRDVTDDGLDGTPQPRKSAHQARKDGDYGRLTTGLRACQSEADLIAWADAEKNAMGAIPTGWVKEIREEWSTMREAFRAKAADPDGLKIDVPGQNADDEMWLAYVNDVIALLDGAVDADQVQAVQVINGLGLTAASLNIEGVPESIAAAAETRLAILSAREG